MSFKDTKRILIVSRCSNPHGGADRIVADLCRELPKLNWHVSLGLTKGKTFNLPQVYREVYPDLPIVEIDGRLGTRRARLAALKRIIQHEQPDVVLSMRVFDAYEAVASFPGPKSPRLVVGVRAFEDAYLADIRHYMHQIDGCVTSGKLIAAVCREFCGIASERVESIAGGIHPPCTKVVSRNPTSPIKILYAGRLEQEQKRCLDLIPFVAGLIKSGIKFKLDIAGIGPEEALLRDKLISVDTQECIQFHGWVDREFLYSTLYPETDLFIHFASWEGVTISPREAMAHGAVPVISRFRGLQAEGQFQDGVNSLTFPVSDIASAVACVRRLIDDPKLIGQLSTAAMKSQIGRYSFSGAIHAWDQFLRKIADSPKNFGPLPIIREQLHGRLTKWGVPDKWQVVGRSLLGISVQHHSPGSEWPTSSGQLTNEEISQIRSFESALEKAIPSEESSNLPY